VGVAVVAAGLLRAEPYQRVGGVEGQLLTEPAVALESRPVVEAHRRGEGQAPFPTAPAVRRRAKAWPRPGPSPWRTRRAGQLAEAVADSCAWGISDPTAPTPPQPAPPRPRTQPPPPHHLSPPP